MTDPAAVEISTVITPTESEIRAPYENARENIPAVFVAAEGMRPAGPWPSRWARSDS